MSLLNFLNYQCPVSSKLDSATPLFWKMDKLQLFCFVDEGVIEGLALFKF